MLGKLDEFRNFWMENMEVTLPGPWFPGNESMQHVQEQKHQAQNKRMASGFTDLRTDTPSIHHAACNSFYPTLTAVRETKDGFSCSQKWGKVLHKNKSTSNWNQTPLASDSCHLFEYGWKLWVTFLRGLWCCDPFCSELRNPNSI